MTVLGIYLVIAAGFTISNSIKVIQMLKGEHPDSDRFISGIEELYKRPDFNPSSRGLVVMLLIGVIYKSVLWGYFLPKELYLQRKLKRGI